MEQLQENLGIKLDTANPVWSWAARHAAWLVNRFKPVRGVTAYEPTHGCLGSPALHLSSQLAKENANGTRLCSLGRLKTKMPSSASIGRRSY